MIFLDVDGVICNWTLGFADLAKIPESKRPIGGNLEFRWAEDTVKPRSIWSYKLDQFFWSELPAYPYAAALVQTVEKFDKNFRFLTASPNESAFHSGRAQWIKREFGTKYLDKLIICCKDKSFCARNNVLIDDKQRNIDSFCNNGGYGYLWKEVNGLKWTHASVDRWLFQLKELEEYLGAFDPKYLRKY